jgi:tripartite ATP-independent transporter DctM subunit
VNPTLAALMFPALLILVFAGIPVSFSLMVTAFGFGIVVFGDKTALQAFAIIEQVSSNYLLSAIPLFVLMGAVLERSGISARLFDVTQLWLGRLPGGLAVATIALCAIFAASAGIVGAVEVLVGLMAIPAMTRCGYDRRLITGTICAGGSLGTIIPPSVIVIIYASIAQISVGKLFAGIIIPGTLMVVLFILYVIAISTLRPDLAPRVPVREHRLSLGAKLRTTAVALVPAVVLVLAVLGTILAGIASPTEAAGVGAAGAIVLTIFYRRFSVGLLIESLRVTIKLTSMIALIVVGGTMFTSIFTLLGGSRLVSGLIEAYTLGPYAVVALFLLVVFLAGFVLDWTSVVLIAIPIFTPVITKLGVDPFWFAVMVLVTIQTAYLTPPMAPAIFYLRAVAPPDWSYAEMYLGVAPFIVIQLLVLAIVALVPQTATYLPTVLVGF